LRFGTIDIKEAKQLARKANLIPAKVSGTDIIRFTKKGTKGNTGNLDEISWVEFESIMKKNKLVIRSWKSWMKIMKK
jgi:hypothetical protein